VKVAHPFALVVLVLVGAGTATVVVHKYYTDSPHQESEHADYDAFVERFGGDEPAVRDELNELICTSSATLDPADRAKANALKRECLDGKTLLEIGHLQLFIAERGEGMAYHFVGAEHHARLRAIAGDRPSAERVLAIRKGLAQIAAGFEIVCQPPDWSIKIEGEGAPPLPLLNLLSETHRSFPSGEHLSLRANPRLPAFSATDAELLIQLDRFWNSATVRAALPPDRFAKLYRNGRIPPIPTAIGDYQEEFGAVVLTEQRILLPEEQRDAEGVQALNEVYGRLEPFLSAIVTFDK
jgi:hypothetical protein